MDEKIKHALTEETGMDVHSQGYEPPAKTVVFLIGPTCCGKTTLIDESVKRYPGTAGIKVGKLLRAKYGEAYFRGQGAPAHTQAEAQSMMEEELRRLLVDNDFILVDGQPRTPDHVPVIIELCNRLNLGFTFVILTASEEKRLERAVASRTGDNLELAKSRLRGDYENEYKVLVTLIDQAFFPHVLFTDNLTPDECVTQLDELLTHELF